MAFVREIGRNGVLYSGIWPWHRLSNWIESNRYISERVKQLIKLKKGISVTSLQIIVPYEHVTVYWIESNRIELKYISINRIVKISYQWHHYMEQLQINWLLWFYHSYLNIYVFSKTFLSAILMTMQQYSLYSLWNMGNQNQTLHFYERHVWMGWSIWN